MAEQKGAFEELASAIERLLPAEGDVELVVHDTVSRDSRKSRTGGEYDFSTCFRPVGDGILVYNDTSCELHINGMGPENGSTIPCIVGLEGLRRIAAQVGLRTTCEKFLKKQASFADLREALELAAPA